MAYDFELAINCIPGLAWSAEPHGFVDFLNKPWLDYTGLALEDALGWGWQAAIHPDDLPALSATWKQVLGSGQAGAAEARLRRHDGVHRWFIFHAVPRYEGTQLFKWYGQTIDIEERKRAELRQAHENSLLEMIARGASLAAVLHSICEQIEELVAGSIASILLFDPARNCLRHAAGPRLPRSLIAHIDGRVIGTGGGPCGIAASTGKIVVAPDLSKTGLASVAAATTLRSACCTPILSADRRVLGTFALYWEHTEPADHDSQKALSQLGHVASIAIERAEVLTSLSRSERYFAEAQRLSQTGSFSWNPESGEILWSDEVYRIYEIDPSETITMERAMTQVHPDDLDYFTRVAGNAVEAKTDFTFEHRIVTAKGALKYLEVHARAERDGDDCFTEYVGAVRDVTELRLSEAALMRTQDELAHASRVATLGELTGSIAHELNQPLTGIGLNAKACLRWLAAVPAELSEARLAAERIVRDTQRAAHVIDRLRAMFNKAQVPHLPVELGPTIHEVLVLARSELQRHHVDVRTELDAEVEAVSADKVQIQQVVLNLLVNAIEALRSVPDRPREIRISTARADSGGVHVMLADNGEGIPPARLDKIFDAFYTSKAGGMGLGLAISKSIVERLGGKLWVEQNQAQGVTFHFTLAPRAEATID